MPSPSNLRLLQTGEDAGNIDAFKEICVRDYNLPSDAQESAEAIQMEVVELAGVSAVDSLVLSDMEESGENHCVVDHELGHQTESPFLPDFLTESPETVTDT